MPTDLKPITPPVEVVIPWDARKDPYYLRAREWLVSNGLGGYASGTLLGEATRRYHGLFIPNLPAPYGRTVMLPRLDDRVMVGTYDLQLSGGEFADGRVEGEGAGCLKEFRLDWQIPTWTYDINGTRLQKRITMPNGQNTVYVEYKVLSGHALRLTLRPYITLRNHEDLTPALSEWPFTAQLTQDRVDIQFPGSAPVLRLALRPQGGVFIGQWRRLEHVYYPIERERGLDDQETLFSPGVFAVDVEPGQAIAFVASVEPWSFLEVASDTVFEAERRRLEKLLSQAVPAAQEGWARHLVLAADQFIVKPGTRIEETALQQAAGEPVCTVMAGYHWFTDWGRDTMIALEGLTLCTGRFSEARAILRTFSHYVKDGLLPNHFPEGQRTALYHTVDATFWFFHAIDRYVTTTNDQDTLAMLYPTLVHIIEHHIQGTHYGIGMDAKDGLIREGFPDYPLTWMDAKAGDAIFTPRRGKPVEIQALWYNALRLMAEWATRHGQPSDVAVYQKMAQTVYDSFNARYWYAEGGYLYDIVDGEEGNDTRLRPNQMFSFSLRHPVLDPSRWAAVLDIVGKKLWTPLGLRTLSPEHPDFKASYKGTRLARDAAYHQGLVWAWLAGAYIDGWRRVHQDTSRIPELLKAFEAHIRDAGVGSISEIFEAEAPYTPRGCIAQAWSIAEILRVLTRAREA